MIHGKNERRSNFSNPSILDNTGVIAIAEYFFIIVSCVCETKKIEELHIYKRELYHV
jgi:hypothetical protein